MLAINIHEAKTHLSRLVEEAARGKSFIIAKAGKPLVKVVPLLDEPQSESGRLGFMAGEIVVPDDFDGMCSAEVQALFAGGGDETAA